MTLPASDPRPAPHPAAGPAAPGPKAESTRPPAAAAPADRLEEDELDLVAYVDFKWLMSGEGHRIDIGRLKQDRCYARACLSLAAGSACPPLRMAAERLGRDLGIGTPTA